MDTFSPAVVTSKAARDDFENIKVTHSDLLNGMANQAGKAAVYNQQKSADLAQQNAMHMDMEKEKMAADSQDKKDAMTFAQKQAELDIKRAALSSI